MTTDTQRRAAAGGEVGPNGEHYRGGQWIATTHHPKVPATPRREPTPEEVAVMEARAAREAARAASISAWMAERLDRFGPLLVSLDADKPAPGLEHVQTFGQSLAAQLRESGSISPKQARCALRFLFGRRNRSNGDEWDALEELLPQRWSE